jgi:hypothetical protein
MSHHAKEFLKRKKYGGDIPTNITTAAHTTNTANSSSSSSSHHHHHHAVIVRDEKRTEAQFIYCTSAIIIMPNYTDNK